MWLKDVVERCGGGGGCRGKCWRKVVERGGGWRWWREVEEM